MIASERYKFLSIYKITWSYPSVPMLQNIQVGKCKSIEAKLSTLDDNPFDTFSSFRIETRHKTCLYFAHVIKTSSMKYLQPWNIIIYM